MTEFVNVRTNYKGNTFDTITSAELLERIINNIPTYEVISDDITPKLYLDFDLEVPKDEFHEAISLEMERILTTSIKKHLKFIFEKLEPNLCIATCHTENYTNETSKYSIRYFISNIKATRETQEEFCKDINKYILDNTDINDYVTKKIENPFDLSVYSPLRKMRCLTTSKPDQNRPFILKQGTIENSIINGYFDNVCEEIIMEKPLKLQKPKSPNSVTQIPKDATKLQELLKLIKLDDKKDRKTWAMICSFIKYNFMTNDDWIQFCKDNELNLDKEKEELFDKIKDYNIEIYYLQALAKKSNHDEYKEWIKRWNIYWISFNEVMDPYACACKISKTLKHTLKLCNETWYMLTDNNLWKSQKEPTFYIIKEIHKYLDVQKDILCVKSTEAEGDAKSVIIKSMENWFKLYTVITKSGYLSVLTKTLRPLLTNDDFEKKLDNNKGKLAFKNGIMDLESRVFRYGIEWDDFITDTIPFDYVPCKYDYLKSILLPILNNNKEHLEYYLSIIGYSFIGDAELEKALYFMIDKTEEAKGNNGKTFFFDILNDLLPNYVYKSKSTFILKSNTKAHKQLAKMKGKRLVWLEELPKDETNAVLMKEIADGKTTENEVMYGTSEEINIMFKLFVLSNNIPKIGDDEEAVYNRLKQISFNSHFDTSGERKEINIEKLEFIADKELATTIKTKYYNEIFNMIIDYANQYYKNKLPKVPSQFLNDTKDTKNKNDKFIKWFKENCIEDEDKKIALEFLVEQTKVSKETIISKMKPLGFIFNKDLAGMGKKANGKYYKGGFQGVGLDDDEEE